MATPAQFSIELHHSCCSSVFPAQRPWETEVLKAATFAADVDQRLPWQVAKCVANSPSTPPSSLGWKPQFLLPPVPSFAQLAQHSRGQPGPPGACQGLLRTHDGCYLLRSPVGIPWGPRGGGDTGRRECWPAGDNRGSVCLVTKSQGVR